MKSSGNVWRLHLVNILRQELKFNQCYADNDVWMCPSFDNHGILFTSFYVRISEYRDDLSRLNRMFCSQFFNAVGIHALMEDGVPIVAVMNNTNV